MLKKKEYLQLPTTEDGVVEEAPARWRSSRWKRVIPLVAVFAMVAFLAIANPMGCGRADNGLAGYKLMVPGYSHLPMSEFGPIDAHRGSGGADGVAAGNKADNATADGDEGSSGHMHNRPGGMHHGHHDHHPGHQGGHRKGGKHRPHKGHKHHKGSHRHGNKNKGLSGLSWMTPWGVFGKGAATYNKTELLKEAACPAQPDVLNVGPEWDPSADDAFAQKAAERLSKAVQIDTVSQDNMPADATDPAFDGHYKFAEFLKAEYPTVFETLDHEIVNTHGHLFTWKGKYEDRKPVFLMAHEDTVPVNPDTEDQWEFPPWSGEITYDATPETPGTWIWGRGSSDCKNSLVGILHALEKLVAEDFQPERTVLVGYGFDEEIGGARGALEIKKVIEERYGSDSIEFIIDEGFSGIEETYGIPVASLGMAEKGAMSVKLTVDTPGGHSSVAPVHTGIGYMARFLTALEDHPYEPELEAQSPYIKYLSCLAQYAPKFPKKLRRRVENPKRWPKLAQDLADSDRVLNAFLSTTTAIDLINGGVKVNALPERVEATVNHRISFVSDTNATMEHYLELIGPLADKLGFSSTIFGEQSLRRRSTKHLTIEIVGNEHKHGLEPAPITPGDTPAFAFIAGTVKATFGKKTVVAPTGMFANTDTARTWSLTKNIYRWTPADLSQSANVHTVNERISLKGHLDTTKFYYKLLRNTEGWEA